MNIVTLVRSGQVQTYWSGQVRSDWDKSEQYKSSTNQATFYTVLHEAL